MKRWTLFLTNNWSIKLASLAAAVLIWLFIRHNIAYSPPSYAAPLPMLPND
jgi:hypothetical protein